MNDYLLAPDPGGHNRALDRVAAEHLRAVAPHLAPCLSCQAGICAEHGPTVTAATTGERDGILSESRLLLAVPMPPVPPQPEPAKADAPRKGSKAWAIQEACRIVGIAFHGIAEYDEASDCFCSESPHQDYRNGGHALAFVEQAVREKLAREKAPAPEAAGEMSREEFEAAVSDLEYTARVVGARICAGYPGAGRERLQIARSIETRLIAAHDHLRASRDEERARADMYSDLHAKECQDGAQRLSAALRERDEAREQRDAAQDAQRLAERKVAGAEAIATSARARADKMEARLAAAEAEVKRRDEYPHPCLICFGVRPASGKPCACNGTNNVYTAFDYLNAEAARLRLAYDDPTTDATDGAHPAWWRGSDAGVAGAVRIVNEALDGPLPLPGCVGGADLEAVRQRVAALRASVARLVETGDGLRYRGTDPVAHAAWAAAKAGRALDAPAGSEAKR